MIDARDPTEEAAIRARLSAQLDITGPDIRPVVDVEICILCLGAGEIMTTEGAAMCGWCMGLGEE